MRTVLRSSIAPLLYPRWEEMPGMYTGTLIHDLFRVVEQAERASQYRSEPPKTCSSAVDAKPDICDCRRKNSEPEKFAQPLGLSAADRDLGLLFIVHPELVRTLEPGDDLADTVDVHEVGAVGAPK